MSMESTKKIPHPDCEQALEIHLRQLLGENVLPGELQVSSRHIEGCKTCQQLQVELVQTQRTVCDSYRATAVSEGCSRRTMAALPSSAKASAAAHAPQVFSSPGHNRRVFIKRALAAAVAISVLGFLSFEGWRLWATAGTAVA